MKRIEICGLKVGSTYFLEEFKNRGFHHAGKAQSLDGEIFGKFEEVEGDIEITALIHCINVGIAHPRLKVELILIPEDQFNN